VRPDLFAKLPNGFVPMFQFMNPAYDSVLSSKMPKNSETYLEVVPEEGWPETEVEAETGSAEEDAAAKLAEASEGRQSSHGQT
jgi:hypothetical protein